MDNLALLGPILVGYLLGSIPFGLLIAQLGGAGDIRKIGSGNIGATNVLRTGRKGLAAATLLLDGGKGAAAVLIGAQFGAYGVLLGGMAAVLGHLFPVWLKFKGGKGVATGFGVLIAASPIVGLASGAIWICAAKLMKISSASALLAFLCTPPLMVLLDGRDDRLVLAVVVMCLVWARHHGNIRRLIDGTEPRIGQR